MVCERTHDRDGYDAYRFVLYYMDSPVDIVICDNVSQRKANEQVASLVSKKYQAAFQYSSVPCGCPDDIRCTKFRIMMPIGLNDA